MTVRVRIAPSPTGDPHVGTAYIGLMNYCFAKAHGGKFVLRIEDTDQTRCTEESAQNIYAAMKWLGLPYNEGPDVGGDHGPYVQSERVKLGLYRKYADQLIAQGDAYYCFATARELEEMKKRQRANNEPIMYDRRYRGYDPAEAKKRAEAGEPYVVRMKTPLRHIVFLGVENEAENHQYARKELDSQLWETKPEDRDFGTNIHEFVYRDRLRKQPVVKAWKDIDDQVLLKSDGWPTYHLAAVVDDHLMGITHVIRAEEWLNSLPKHIWLNRKLGFVPPEYVHVGLLRNADKSKISKRKNPTSLKWYQQQGFLPEALLNFLALLGHSHPEGKEKFDLAEMIGFFDLDRINVAGPVFDLLKLRHLQGLYFRELSPERAKAEVIRAVESRFVALFPLLTERMTCGGDFLAQAEPFYAETVTHHVEDLVPKGVEKAQAKGLLEALQKDFKHFTASETAVWDAPSLEGLIRGVIAERSQPPAIGATPEQIEAAKLWSNKTIFTLLRVAATGRKEAPPLFDTLAQIGQMRVNERLGAAVMKLK